jgi:FemAB-related protein (PEP-CTERM system-associated)
VGRGRVDREAHYRVYSESVRNLGTPVFPRALFDEMLQEFREDADILTIRKDGKPIASVLSFYFKNTVYPYWGGGGIDARTWRANELMYFELMRHAASRGCTRFDFGRSKLGTGAYAFKKNWGFEPQPLTYAVRTPDGSTPREINPLSPKYRLQIALWKKLPLWAANRLGPPIARGLG